MECSIRKLKDYLPTFYHNILPDKVLSKPLGEIDKCTNCIMACGEKPRYNEKTKCCTYYPFIPNYMVGNILLNNEVEAQKIRSYIETKKYILPIGLCVPEGYQHLQGEYKSLGFGKDESLLCQFYDEGNCNIWNQRNSECLSFQCYSSYGQKGFDMWKVLGDLIYELEIYIANSMMTAHQFPEQMIEDSIKYIKYEHFSKKTKDKYFLSEEEWGEHWVKHSDSVAQYFISCYKKSTDLDLTSFVSGLSDYKKLNELLSQ